MKIIITGSLGNISRPLAEELVQKGHSVTVISSNSEKQKDIEALGAAAAIGSLEDVNFLASIFTGADAVYCMVPPANFFDPDIDLMAYCQRIGDNYAQAIRESGVKRVVHLSGLGAHIDKGTGFILAHHYVEKVLKEVPGVAITHMRAPTFYYNFYSYIDMIKQAGIIAANYGEIKVPMVSPLDIAAAIADEIVTPINGRKVRYVAGDEQTGNEIAGIIGAAIGMPHLQWIIIPDEQVQNSLESFGMPAASANLIVEMYAAFNNEETLQDYYLNKPVTMGKVKLTDFAKEFAYAFNQK